MSGLKSTLRNAKKDKAREDWLREHGQTSDNAFVAGVRDIMPLDAYEKPLASGTDYVLPEGKVTVYNGRVRYIDQEVFDNDVDQFIKRQKHVDKLVRSFLQTGDAVCEKYLGYYYTWLPAGQPTGNALNALKKYMKYDGMREETASNKADALREYDGTPDHINSYPNPSKEYTHSLYKLMTILKYTCIVFMGKDGMAAPEIGASGKSEFEEIDNKAGDKTKSSVQQKRFVAPNQDGIKGKAPDTTTSGSGSTVTGDK